MTTILACRPMAADGQQHEIVSFDLDSGRVTVLERPPAGRTFQAPKLTPTGRLAFYEFPAGGNYNYTAEQAVLVIDGKRLTPPVQGGGWADLVTWGKHGHVAFRRDGLRMVHAVERVRKPWWWFPIIMPWALIETDMDMRNPKVLAENQAEPAINGIGLTCISTAGNGAVISPRRTFPKTDSTHGWWDPHTSPDGKWCVWLVLDNLLPIRWSLSIGDTATGEVRKLIPGADWVLQTDALWLDNSTLIAGRKERNDPGFRLIRIDAPTGKWVWVSGPEHGSLEAAWPTT